MTSAGRSQKTIILTYWILQMYIAFVKEENMTTSIKSSNPQCFMWSFHHQEFLLYEFTLVPSHSADGDIKMK